MGLIIPSLLAGWILGVSGDHVKELREKHTGNGKQGTAHQAGYYVTPRGQRALSCFWPPTSPGLHPGASPVTPPEPTPPIPRNGAPEAEATPLIGCHEARTVSSSGARKIRAHILAQILPTCVNLASPFPLKASVSSSVKWE